MTEVPVEVMAAVVAVFEFPVILKLITPELSVVRVLPVKVFALPPMAIYDADKLAPLIL